MHNCMYLLVGFFLPEAMFRLCASSKIIFDFSIHTIMYLQKNKHSFNSWIC